MVEKSLIIKNEAGLHMRPASELVKISGKCKSDVTIIHNEKSINAKSILNVMAAGIKFQDSIIVRCEGETEAEDLENLVNAIESGLNE